VRIVVRIAVRVAGEICEDNKVQDYRSEEWEDDKDHRFIYVRIASIYI
jgi:hypothetical protein